LEKKTPNPHTIMFVFSSWLYMT